jgi:hypothetical protein
MGLKEDVMEVRKRFSRGVITTTCEVLGLIMVVAGIGTLAIPAGIIAAGLSLIAIGYFLA